MPTTWGLTLEKKQSLALKGSEPHNLSESIISSFKQSQLWMAITMLIFMLTHAYMCNASNIMTSGLNFPETQSIGTRTSVFEHHYTRAF